MENEKLLHSIVRLLARQELLLLSLVYCLDQKQAVPKEEFIQVFERMIEQGAAERLADKIWLRIQKEQDIPWDLGDLF